MSAPGDLTKFVGKTVHVKFVGGRQVAGTLRGFDGLMNLVLEDAIEHFAESSAEDSTPKSAPRPSRKLGTTMCRGPSVVMVAPQDGFEEIPNPFVAPGEE